MRARRRRDDAPTRPADAWRTEVGATGQKALSSGGDLDQTHPYCLGLDLAQTAAVMARAVVESVGTLDEQPVLTVDEEYPCPTERTVPVVGAPVQHQVRHLERFPLQTPCATIVERVAALGGQLPAPNVLAVDVTAVGQAGVDLLGPAGLAFYAISRTLGDAGQGGKTVWRVPKQDLVSVLPVAAEAGRLQIARALPLAEPLVQELLRFPGGSRDASPVADGPWRTGRQDDLVLAVALACWLNEQRLAAQGAAVAYDQAAREVERLTRVHISPV